MKLKIHRGTNQIGGNIIEAATDSTKIMLDCGANLPPLDGSQYEDTMEIDGLTRGGSSCDAVFITHYHSDHCGLMSRVKPGIPIYASRETKGVLEIISDFVDLPEPKIRVLEPGVAIDIGDVKILPIGVRHSARGAMMFLVESGGEKILYTGDFGDFKGVDYGPLNGVAVMVCEGTNINAHGGLAEEDVEAEAEKIMRDTAGFVFVLCSAANADRVASIEAACLKSGRTIAIDPFMKAVTDRIAPLKTPRPAGFVPHFISAKEKPRAHKYLAGYLASGGENFAGAKETAQKDGLVLMVRPTMGDFIRRINKHKELGDSAVIYSMWSGYKKTKPISGFLALCESLGMAITDLHASGHAYRREIEAAIRRVSPKALIPVHTQSARTFKTMHGNVVLLKDGAEFECES